MVSIYVKLILSLLTAGVGFWQYTINKPIAAAFFFMICGLLFFSFCLDILRALRQYILERRKLRTPVPAAPSSRDYQDSPNPSDLKIGKIFRAAEVYRYTENIQKLAEENPDYALSESEIVDNYLTDKKIWKYIFHPQPAALKPLKEDASGENTLGVFVSDLQIGSISAADVSGLKKSGEGEGLEVVYCSIGGGPFKTVYDDPCSGKYTMTNDEKPYSVTMSICEN